MGRSTVRRVQRPVGRRAMDGLVLVGIVIVLVFAIIGLVSSGIFLAGKANGKAAPRTPTVRPTADTTLKSAHAQATAIVADAQKRAGVIVTSSTKRAHKQAKTILNTARRQASAITATTPTTSTTSTTASGVATNLATPTPIPVAAGSSVASPNLSGLPKSWLVVAYNPTFGNGPGSVGGIGVINRSSTLTFSGTVTLTYNRGGSDSASFAGLAPGHSAVLALNGRPFKAGGYHISVNTTRQ